MLPPEKCFIAVFIKASGGSIAPTGNAGNAVDPRPRVVYDDALGAANRRLIMTTEQIHEPQKDAPH
ncbi:hypothetical protein [Candidatus Desulfovibrio trichonymphae]|uniref:hypothetical protein n=1 Tax=Candidatus Desulfovibrio trichonymphae TaxID=1725232 RepID=UPI000BBA728F|nr:hypothetical protein [Candidatus Desulfovibrio trichonymphae]GHU98587.1 hypothetical protein AGMMS50248_05380 [Deltaproteobacteria bacterium]